jgi:TRAP-type C4-dicarboxylate transport system substrate-binding protein
MKSISVKTAFAALAVICSISTANAEETRLLFTSMSPAGSTNSQYFRAWADKVNGESQGRLKIEVRDGLTLANYGNVYDRVNDDVVQIGWAIHQVLAGKFKLSEVGGVPFMADNAAPGALAMWRLYKTGRLDEEYKDIVPLWFTLTAQAGVHFAKPPKTVDNLQGDKVAVLGRTHGAMVEKLGGTPLALSSTDFYEALQRGTIDAGIISWAAFVPFKLQEVSTYHLEGPFGANTMVFFMARKKYDALPEAARKALDANTGEAMSRAFGTYMEEQGAIARKPVSASDKHTIVQLTPQQYDTWNKQVVVPVVDAWAKERAGGEKAVETYRTLIAQAKTGQ